MRGELSKGDRVHVLEVTRLLVLRRIAKEAGVLQAFEFAAAAHDDQHRKDGKTPYIHHPARVMAKLVGFGVKDHGVLTAALLHDVVEDTKVTAQDIERRFGSTVAFVVRELTKDQSGASDLTRRAYVERFRDATPAACLIKLVDRTDNLNDWSGMIPAYKPAYAKEGLAFLEAIDANQQVAEMRVANQEFYEAFSKARLELLTACDAGGRP